MHEPPRWWSDTDALPEWTFDVFTDAQLAMSNLSKWTHCVRMLAVTPTTQHVGLVLATYMDATTLKAFPSVGTLSLNTGRKKVTVRNSIRDLEAYGWMHVERFRNARGDERVSNRYYGMFPDELVVLRAGGNGKVVELCPVVPF